MGYREHRKAYIDYLQAQKTMQRLVNERIVLFQMTQPKSPSYTDKVQGGTKTNKTEEYVIAIEQRKLKERLSEAQEIVEQRKYLLKEAEADLRRSTDIYDIVYTAKWIDGEKPDEIANKIYYSRSHVYSIIARITRQLERDL